LENSEYAWEDLVSSKMYITGRRWRREVMASAFGDAYELADAQAYGESCARSEHDVELANVAGRAMKICRT